MSDKNFRQYVTHMHLIHSDWFLGSNGILLWLNNSGYLFEETHNRVGVTVKFTHTTDKEVLTVISKKYADDKRCNSKHTQIIPRLVFLRCVDKFASSLPEFLEFKIELSKWIINI